MGHRLDPAVLMAAAWALHAVRCVRGTLMSQRLDVTAPRLVVPKAPRLPDRGRRGVAAVLHRRRATCLMSAAILQEWDAAHGRRRDVVIGVTTPSEGFRAHAWLDGDHACGDGEFAELLRVPAR